MSKPLGKLVSKSYRTSWKLAPDKIIEVEALRYLYLDSLIRTPRTIGEAECLRVLVIGDIVPRSTLKLITMVSLAIDDFPENVKCVSIFGKSRNCRYRQINLSDAGV